MYEHPFGDFFCCRMNRLGLQEEIKEDTRQAVGRQGSVKVTKGAVSVPVGLSMGRYTALSPIRELVR